ncbi:hypothetical protein U1Q18_016782 [Sarracenia purpurea var. burkii]
MDSIYSHKSGEHHHHRSPSSELSSSAEVKADADQAPLHDETNKMDMGRLAGAGSDILGAVSDYFKLEETGAGQYVEKAETYLHEYGSSHPSTTTNAAAAPTSTTSHSGGGHGHGHSESGSGDYFKKDETYLHQYGSSNSSTTPTTAASTPTSTTSHSGGDQGHSESGSGEESGYGDYFKMAEGFLKKH